MASLAAGTSFPRKAYSRVVESFRTASENIVSETKRLPLLESLLENIECLAAELVAAGGLQSYSGAFSHRPGSQPSATYHWLLQC